MPDTPQDRTDARKPTRRRLLQAAGAGSVGAALSKLFETGAAATGTKPRDPTDGTVFEVERLGGTDAYPQSVASGGPTPSGVIAWTRLAPETYRDDEPVGVEVATDEAMDDVIYRGVVPAEAFGPQTDYTVNADLDGELLPNRHLFYRFVHDGVASPVGRCRTLPEPDASPEHLSLAVASCNSWGAGYFGAYAHIAEEDVDFLLHLGDFIYEARANGDKLGKSFEIPSGNKRAHTLADYRKIHRVYRDEAFLERALEKHTLVHIWDDHELVNNPWWNDEADAPATNDHPYSGQPEKLKRLFVAAIKAYSEYVPTRLYYDGDEGGRIDPDAIHDEFRLYRSLRFGDLAELFMTDERLYRSGPPEDRFGRREDSIPPSQTADDPDRTMLGEEQLEWFLNGGANPDGLPDTDGVAGSDAQWTVWGNSVMHAAMKQLPAGPATWYNTIARATYDCWDGYRHERSVIADALADVDNVVVLSGDFHTYLVAYLKKDYEDATQYEYASDDGRIGVEFITTSMTSGSYGSSGVIPPTAREEAINQVVQTGNPHIEWFNSSRWGYAVLDITRDDCTYTAWNVDREVDSADAPKKLCRRYRVPEGRVELEEVARSPLDRLIGDIRGVNSEVGLPDAAREE